MDVERISSLLKTYQPWSARADGYWLDDHDLDIKRVAHLMVELGARLATITALPGPDGEIRLIYHWDIGGKLFNIGTCTRGGKMPSIAEICPAADWIEREVHDYFTVVFTGRVDLAPLVLRKGEPPGLFHWNGRDQEAER